MSKFCYVLFNEVFLDTDLNCNLDDNFNYYGKNYNYIKEHYKEFSAKQLREILVLYKIKMDFAPTEKYYGSGNQTQIPLYKHKENVGEVITYIDDRLDELEEDDFTFDGGLIENYDSEDEYINSSEDSQPTKVDKDDSEDSPQFNSNEIFIKEVVTNYKYGDGNNSSDEFIDSSDKSHSDKSHSDKSHSDHSNHLVDTEEFMDKIIQRQKKREKIKKTQKLQKPSLDKVMNVHNEYNEQNEQNNHHSDFQNDDSNDIKLGNNYNDNDISVTI